MGTALIVLKCDGRVVILPDVDQFLGHANSGTTDILGIAPRQIRMIRKDGSWLSFPQAEIICASYYPVGTEARMQADLKALMAGAKKK